MPIQSISAVLTDYARQLIARGLTEGVVLGDWSFQVGTDGFDSGDPRVAEDVDSSLQVLGAAVGGTRYLGRILSSGFGASAALTAEAGVIQINGLAGIPNAISKRWLRVSGAGSANLNGVWNIREWVSATSVRVNAPLVTALDAGPLGWEFREACMLQPNNKAVSFHGRLLRNDATVDGQELGELGIFCRVIRAPGSPGLLGDSLLFANAHHPAVTKAAESVISYHCIVQS